MTRKLPFAFAALFLIASVPPAVTAQAKRPNLIIVLADDLGYGDLACYGHPVIKTPSLDAFARKAMKFPHGYSGGSVCSPSRSAILTGRTPYRNGVFTWIPEGSHVHLRNTEVTLATLLRALGYTTCHVGKWHLNGLFNSPKQPQPNDHGYDWWLATQNNAAPSHKNPDNFVRNGKKVGLVDGFSAEIVADEAVHWLRKERDKSKPFFMTMWFHEPHLPIESSEKFQDLYPELKAKDPDLAQHHANVTQMDHAFGKLMRALEELNLSEDTLIVFTSDNGPEGQGTKGRTRGSTGGLRGRKRSLYEGGIRVPFMIAWPGKIPPGKSNDTPVIGSDLFPTLLEAAGEKLPRERVIDGTCLLPLFEGKTIDRKVPLYWRYHGAPEEFKVAMRQGDHTLLANLEFTRFELYNLKNDPKQTKNLVDDEPKLFASMRTALRNLNSEIEREGPEWWKGYSDAKKKKDVKKK